MDMITDPSGWAELRRLRRAFFLSAMLLIVVGVIAIAAFITSDRVGLAFVAVAVAVAVARGINLLIGRRLARWPCPRCQQPFSGGDLSAHYRPTGNVCANCGLAHEGSAALPATAT